MTQLNLQFQVKSDGNNFDDQFVRGIPIYIISQVIDNLMSAANGPSLLINGVQRPMPLIRTLEVEFYPMPLSEARSFGLTDDWIQVCLLSGTLFFCML